MQLCGNCGNKNSDENIFCGHCANKLNHNCPACGFKNLMAQKFCGNCGKELASVGASGFPVEPPATLSQPPLTMPYDDTAPTSNTTIAYGSAPQNIAVASGAASLVPSELEFYALASVELMPWQPFNASNPDLPAYQPDASTIHALQNQCQENLLTKIRSTNGRINASKKNIVFVSFRHEINTKSSIEKAITIFVDLLSQPFCDEDGMMPLRIGLDVEQITARNPLTSSIERSVGSPGSITLSERAYRVIRDISPVQYKLEAMPPMPMGKRLMQFYRITPSHLTFQPATRVSPPQAEADQDSGIEKITLQEEASATAQPTPTLKSNFEEFITAPGEPDQSFPESGTPTNIPQEPTPETPPALPLPEPTPSPASTKEQESAQQPPLEKTEPAKPPELPGFEPPVLIAPSPPRQPNLTYQSAIEALSTELNGFLTPAKETSSEPKGKIIALYGKDGLGKSSIISMVRAQVDPENQRAIWMGAQNYRCFQSSRLPLIYWIELLQNLLSLMLEGQDRSEVEEQISQFLSYVHNGQIPEAEQAFLKDLLCTTPLQPLTADSTDSLGRIEGFFLNFLTHMSAKRPVILIMEDLQFADGATLVLLTALLEKNLLAFPIYLILTFASDTSPQGELASILQNQPLKDFSVSALSDPEAENFLNDGPLGGRLDEFPRYLVASLLRNAKGLPLYFEESLRLMHLKDILTVDPETYKFVLQREFDPSEVPLPDNVKALIRLRFEFLSEKNLYVLQLASVLGEKFSVGMMIALAQMEDEDFNQSLGILLNHGYLLPDAANSGRFRHGLIWEAVYENIDADLRLQMHQLVSETLEHGFTQDITVNPMFIAHHAEQGSLANRALNYWNLTGIFAARVGSLMGMNMAMFKVLDHAEKPLDTQELPLRLVETLAVFNLESDPALSVRMLEWVCYARGQIELSTPQQVAKLIEPLGFLATAYESQGHMTEALDSVDKALALIDPEEYPFELASLLISKLEYLFVLGFLQRGRDLMDQTIEPLISRREKTGSVGAEFVDAYLQARLLKAQIMMAQGDKNALPVIEDALQHAEKRGMEGLSIALKLARAEFLLREGQYESCNRDADGLLTAIEAMEGSDWFLAQWGLLAIMYHCELEDWTSAAQLVLTVVAKSEASHDYQTWIKAQIYAGFISGKLGRVGESRQLIEQAISLSADYRMASAALLGWRLLADFELTLGNRELAQDLSTNALKIARKPDINHFYEIAKSTLIEARALLALNELKPAGKLLEPIWPQLLQADWQPLIAEFAFEIGQLYKLLAQSAPPDLKQKHLTRSIEFFRKAKGIWLALKHPTLVKRVDAAIPRL